jgi:hypothetical protein
LSIQCFSWRQFFQEVKPSHVLQGTSGQCGIAFPEASSPTAVEAVDAADEGTTTAGTAGNPTGIGPLAAAAATVG